MDCTDVSGGQSEENDRHDHYKSVSTPPIKCSTWKADTALLLCRAVLEVPPSPSLSPSQRWLCPSSSMTSPSSSSTTPPFRVRNFNAGPAGLPLEVMEEAQQELLNFHHTGMGVMEMSHRSPTFERILAQTEHNIRQLLSDTSTRTHHRHRETPPPPLPSFHHCPSPSMGCR